MSFDKLDVKHQLNILFSFSPIPIILFVFCQIKDVILLTEDKYLESLAQGKQTFEKFLRKYEIKDNLSGIYLYTIYWNSGFIEGLWVGGAV